MRYSGAIAGATWIGIRKRDAIALRRWRQKEWKTLPATEQSELRAPIARRPAAEEIACPGAVCGIQASDRFRDAELPCAPAGQTGSTQFARRGGPPTETPQRRRAGDSSNRRSRIALQACITVLSQLAGRV